MDNSVRRGDNVLLYLTRKKKWLVRADADKRVHTHLGYVDLSSILGKEYGSSIMTSVGERLWILKPTMVDLILKAERRTQIVYPKDLGMIVSMTGISSGSIIVEAGTGSGALTTFLANLVKPDGHVFSYEIRPEFIEIAKKNIERADLRNYVTIKQADAKKGFDERDVDVIIIDVGDPWTLVGVAWEALKGGGMIAGISPTMNQVEKLVVELGNTGFLWIESFELLSRGLEARPEMTRPSMGMIGHTAYLTFARKVLKDRYIGVKS
ncbi:MAG: tRNA (adenine-N1)-methyltransferase [Candidatus Methylarchaceae archaeon HK02M1]|nr:tRNA (adenine-N1)-methyltransferase [Candidatus Methylarchaceae archaeon HK02M1]